MKVTLSLQSTDTKFIRNYCWQHGTPGENRTHNGPLGGGCYIHLTTSAYSILAIFYSGVQRVYEIAILYYGTEFLHNVLAYPDRLHIYLIGYTHRLGVQSPCKSLIKSVHFRAFRCIFVKNVRFVI